jgi:hypothetical protein
MSEGLLAYFEQVEAAFCRQRGAPLLLSPLDFEKAAEWYDAGVPAEVVEEGVSAYFERLEKRKVPLRRAVCLSFAEAQVLDALEARRAAAVGRAAGVTERPDREGRVRAFLEKRIEALRAFSADPGRGRAMPVLARFCARAAASVAALVPKAGGSAASLEKALAPLDEEMGSLVLLESPPELLERWRAEAVRRLKAAGGGVDEEVVRVTAERLARQEGLRHYGLLRLSLLFLE